jgi:hypothetical protein
MLQAKKRVTFSEKVIVIHEPEELSEALRFARQSDYAVRLLNKIRYERLLKPVFCTQHRLVVQMRALNLNL